MTVKVASFRLFSNSLPTFYDTDKKCNVRYKQTVMSVTQSFHFSSKMEWTKNQQAIVFTNYMHAQLISDVTTFLYIKRKEGSWFEKVYHNQVTKCCNVRYGQKMLYK